MPIKVTNIVVHRLSTKNIGLSTKKFTICGYHNILIFFKKSILKKAIIVLFKDLKLNRLFREKIFEMI